MFIGRIFQPPNQVVFNSGGAGYMLDSKALQVLSENIDTPKCFPHQHGFWEDVNVASCLKKSTPSIVPYDTRDSLKRWEYTYLIQFQIFSFNTLYLTSSFVGAESGSILSPQACSSATAFLPTSRTGTLNTTRS